LEPVADLRSALHQGNHDRSMKRHHWLLLAAATLFVTGWLLWNVVLVDKDLAGPAGLVAPVPARR
jgi:hypothetical protein